MMRAEQLQTELNMHVLKEKMHMLSFTKGYIPQLKYHVISHTFKCHSVLRDADSERKKQKSGSEQSFINANLDFADRGTVITQR